MSTEAKNWFSAAEIAALGTALIGGLPTSARGSARRAKQNQWECRIVHGKGGKGGLKTEYKLPQEVMKIVQMFLNQNPDFFTKDNKESEDKPYSKPYPVSKATVLTIKSPEPVSMFDTLDADLFIYVTIAVQKMLEKTGKQLDTDKRNDLIQLIYEYCKMRGDCDDEIISKFLNVAG